MNINLFLILELLVALFEAMTFSVLCFDMLSMKQRCFLIPLTALTFAGIVGRNYLPLHSIVNTAAFYLFLFALLLLFCSGLTLQKLLYLVLFFAAEMIGQYAAEYISMPLISAYSAHSSGEGQAQLFTLIVSKLILFLFVVVVCTVQAKNKTDKTAKYHMAIVLIPAISMLEAIVMYPVDWTYIVKTSGAFLTVVVVTAALFSNIVIYLVFRGISKKLKMSEELQLMKQQIAMQQTHLYELQQKNQSIRSMWHDMNNHLDTIRRIRQTGDMAEVDSYIDQLSHKLSDLNPAAIAVYRLLTLW